MASFLRWVNSSHTSDTLRYTMREEYSDIDDETKSFLHTGTAQRSTNSRPTYRTLLVVTVLNLAILILTATLTGIWYHDRYLLRNPDLRRTSSYSPIHDLVDLNPRSVLINGTLFPPKHRDIGRQMPNPEADRVWDEWSTADVIAVSEADIVRMGKDPSTAAKLEHSDWGMGDDKYAAIFDVYHHLHCLNALRHIAYGSYYSTPSASATNETLNEVHINHCIDLLTQALQCSGNVNLVTMHWMETQTYPFPDMSPNRKCIDFDKLTTWRRDNRLDYDKFRETMKRKDGQKAVKLPDGAYVYGAIQHDHGSGHGHHSSM